MPKKNTEQPTVLLESREILTLPLRALRERPNNARRHFDEAKLQELADNIRLHGILQPILARPVPGTKITRDGNGELLNVEGPDPCFEIVFGHRRWRAAQLAGLAAVPVIVREMDEIQEAEINLVENLQRDELDPLDEAQGLRDIMALQRDGQPVHTLETLAARLGRSRDYIVGRLRLSNLGEPVRAAVRAGAVSIAVAKVIAQIPEVREQKRFLDEMLRFNSPAGNPALPDRAPATEAQARKLVAERYCRDLRQGFFPTEDAALLPAAGACGPCPHLAKNQPEGTLHAQAAYLCTRPACFQAKQEAQWQKVVALAVKAGWKGKRFSGFAAVKTVEESRLIFPANLRAGKMGEGGLVEWIVVDEKVGEDFLKEEVLPANAPTWEEVLGATGWLTPEIITAVADQALRLRWLVPLEAALEAARDKQNAEYACLFRDTRRRSGMRPLVLDAPKKREKRQEAAALPPENEPGAVPTILCHRYDIVDDPEGEAEQAAEAADTTRQKTADELAPAIVGAIRKNGPCGALWLCLAEYFLPEEDFAGDINHACAAVIQNLADMAGGEEECLALLEKIGRLYGVVTAPQPVEAD